jgi:drug/metabolite transporter (DMT)-like permease
LVAVVVGVLVFSEHFTLQSLIGLLLILMSVIIVILADQQKKSKRITEQKIIKPH